MYSYYPVAFRLSGRKIIVAGGGKVAERKIAGLIDTEAAITVISPAVTENISGLAGAGELRWLAKPIEAEDLKDAFMIFAATDNHELNQAIKKAAGCHQLVTIADDQAGSDFLVPAQVKRGRLNIAVSTGGASPTLAGKIRKQLEEQFDERYEGYLEFLFQARRRILTEVDDPAQKSQLLAALVSPEFLNSEHREADFLKLYKSKDY